MHGVLTVLNTEIGTTFAKTQKCANVKKVKFIGTKIFPHKVVRLLNWMLVFVTQVMCCNTDIYACTYVGMHRYFIVVLKGYTYNH